LPEFFCCEEDAKGIEKIRSVSREAEKKMRRKIIGLETHMPKSAILTTPSSPTRRF
jgi:hypothetical protein